MSRFASDARAVTLVASLALGAWGWGPVGCAAHRVRPTPPDPGFVRDADGERVDLEAEVPLSTTEELRSARPKVAAAMRWYITAFPSVRPELWVDARDLIFDWLEAEQNELKITPNLAVLGPPERDRRWKFSAYARGVYLSGKALYVFEHPDAAGTMAAELAGVDAMIDFHEVTRVSDPMGTSPKLRRYERKRRRGSLERYLQKRIARGKQ